MSAVGSNSVFDEHISPGVTGEGATGPLRAVNTATPATGFKMRHLLVYDPVLNDGTLLAAPVVLHPAEWLTFAAFEASSKVPVIS